MKEQKYYLYLKKMATKYKFLLALIASLTFGLAPFKPEPHLIGKLKWLAGGGEGMQLMDYGDLLLHGFPWILLVFFGYKLITQSDTHMKDRIKEALQSPDTVIIDVREKNEYVTGHADQAINMPLSDFETHIPSIKKMKGTKLVYCRSGRRSGLAVEKLKQAGVTNAINVKTQYQLK